MVGRMLRPEDCCVNTNSNSFIPGLKRVRTTPVMGRGLRAAVGPFSEAVKFVEVKQEEAQTHWATCSTIGAIPRSFSLR